MIKNIYKSIIGLFVTIMLFFSCADKNEKTTLNSLNFKNVAQGIGHEMVIKYTDSGSLKATLDTNLMKDFTHVDFPYYEFPEGVKLTVFTEDGLESVILADYAIQYEKHKIVDMRGNVRIQMPDSTKLFSDQMFWNQN